VVSVKLSSFAAFAVGAVSWKFIEEPFLRKKRRKLGAIPEEVASDACGADPVLGPGL
jgi:peptidoglycan/LPS O-acetylase OafA/YrhL